MGDHTTDASASGRLPDGTVVHARVLTGADDPDEEWTTGPLWSHQVTTRWGSWRRYEVNGMIIDSASIEEV